MQHYLSVAVKAAREAGKLIRTRLGHYETLETKVTAHDLVTDVDRACEKIVSETILGAFPDHMMLGEEGVTVGAHRFERTADPASIEHLWICDPIDGTTNFVYGVPCSTVAIALAIRGEPVLGVVYDPARDELFSAVKGEGAQLNGRPLRVRSDRTVGESLLATGFPVRPEMREINVRELMAVAPRSLNVRNLGSAELHLAYVAAGRLTGFWERGLSPWDLAAGYVLVTEAGGRMTEVTGTPYTLATSDVLATNGLVHDEVVGLLRLGHQGA